MGRPKKIRKSCCQPGFRHFKPKGISAKDLETITLESAEFEAIKHKYIEDLDQNQIADKLNISQSTFHRILNSANKKIAQALVNGHAIKIEN